MSVQRTSAIRRVALLHVPMAAIVLFALGPYLWMALTSIKKESTLFAPDQDHSQEQARIATETWRLDYNQASRPRMRFRVSAFPAGAS